MNHNKEAKSLTFRRGSVVSQGKTLLMPATEMRCIARAWAEAFDQAADQDFLKPKDFAYMEPVSFNRPYDGGHYSSGLLVLRRV